MGLDRRMKRELAHTKKKLHEREMRMFASMTPEQIIKHIQHVNARHKSNQEADPSMEAADGRQD